LARFYSKRHPGELNIPVTIGVFLLGLGVLLPLMNVVCSLRWGKEAGENPAGRSSGLCRRLAHTGGSPGLAFASLGKRPVFGA